MASRKRISKVLPRDATNIVEMNDNGTRSISSQTEPLKPGMLHKPLQKRRLIRPQSESSGTSKLNPSVFITDLNEYSNEQNKRNKSTQTIKTGFGPTVVNQKQAIDDQMDNLKALIRKRRAEAIDGDHGKIEELMDKINADPPPSWQAASQMWLEIDKLKDRVKAYNEVDSNYDRKDDNNNDDESD